RDGRFKPRGRDTPTCPSTAYPGMSAPRINSRSEATCTS
ncbi:hypothetical protein A2U01_0099910, partial [Trifolium medium]|nr:hypothetical protein [Trifolium medium]